MYRCLNCGAYLDASEKCDCEEELNKKKERTLEKSPIQITKLIINDNLKNVKEKYNG